MANRYLIAGGNSDNPAIYDGGTLPAVDDVLRLNNFTWTVVADITLAEVRGDALAPAIATAPRKCVLNNGVTLTCTNQFVGGTGEGNQGLADVQAGGTATIISPSFIRHVSGVQIGRTLNLVGNCSTIGVSQFSGFHRGAGTLNITGNMDNPANYITDTVEGGTINIVGNILQAGGAGFWIRANHTFTCTGSITSTNTSLIDNPANYNPIVHNGPLITLGSAPVIRTRSPYYGSGPFVNNGEVMALSADRVRLSGANNQWDMVTVGLAARSLRTAGLLTGYPAEADVEIGVTYGPAGEFTGTLSPVNVNTAQLAADLLNEIAVSADPLAERLRNVSTVQTTGAQIQALTIS